MPPFTCGLTQGTWRSPDISHGPPVFSSLCDESISINKPKPNNLLQLLKSYFVLIARWGFQHANHPKLLKSESFCFVIISTFLSQKEYLKDLQLLERRGKWLEGAPVAGVDHTRWLQKKKKKDGERREDHHLCGGILNLILCTSRWGILVRVWVCSQFWFNVCVFATSYGRSQQVGWGQLGRRTPPGGVEGDAWGIYAAGLSKPLYNNQPFLYCGVCS